MTRWAAPVAALLLALAAPTAFAAVANADPSLPEKSAEELITEIAAAERGPFSGEVSQSANLGLPDLSAFTDLAGMTGPHGRAAAFDPMLLVTGTNNWRIWTDAETSAKVALVVSGGEYSVTTNGTDVWLWDSAAAKAIHGTLPEHENCVHELHEGPDLPGLPQLDPGQLDPGEIAAEILAKLDPNTAVSTAGTRMVAGRAAYELVLNPDDPDTRIGEVRLAVDSETFKVLAFTVTNTDGVKAIDVGFTSINFGAPDPAVFNFTPPAGAVVEELPVMDHHGMMPDGPEQPRPDLSGLPEPEVVGTGWSRVVVLPDLEAFGAQLGGFSGTGGAGGLGWPDGTGGAGTHADMDQMRAQFRDQMHEGGTGGSGGPGAGIGASLEAVIAQLPAVSGEWGSGRLFEGTLLTVVLSDDGRVAFGAVVPELLYSALAG